MQVKNLDKERDLAINLAMQNYAIVCLMIKHSIPDRIADHEVYDHGDRKETSGRLQCVS